MLSRFLFFYIVTLFLSITFAFFTSISSKAAEAIIAAALQDTPVLLQAAAKFGKDLGGGFEIGAGCLNFREMLFSKSLSESSLDSEVEDNSIISAVSTERKDIFLTVL